MLPFSYQIKVCIPPFSEDERNVSHSCISPVRRSPLLLPSFGGRSAETGRVPLSETSLKKLFQNFFFFFLLSCEGK